MPTQSPASRCTLCPAGCGLTVVPTGPEGLRTEYPLQPGQGLCPRGAVLGELLTHPRRIVTAGVRRDGHLAHADMPAALQAVLDAARGGPIVLLLDGALPVEEVLAVAAWCRAWPQARLCLVVEPAEEQLLLGAEASQAEYLRDGDLSGCDGFVIVGDAFAANPVCSRGVLERRRAHPATPVVAIDPAVGSAAKLATHRVEVAPGGELAGLVGVARAAGVTLDGPDAPPGAAASAAAAGAALAQCRRLAVLVAAEYARGDDWRRIGYAAGMLAKARGGGLCPQTSGANALAAVRLTGELETISLVRALAGGAGVRLAVGCDVVGMLGNCDADILAAAAALPNRTTQSARIVLPVALADEVGGTYLLSGARPVEVAPLMAPPRGVPTPAGLVAALARAAGVAPPRVDRRSGGLDRLAVAPPPEAPARAPEPPRGKTVLLARQSLHAGTGWLTASASWQRAVQPLPEVRVSPEDAARAGLKNLTEVTVRVNGQAVRAIARVCPELPPGRLVLPEGCPEARALAGVRLDAEADTVSAFPAAGEVRA